MATWTFIDCVRVPSLLNLPAAARMSLGFAGLAAECFRGPEASRRRGVWGREGPRKHEAKSDPISMNPEAEGSNIRLYEHAPGFLRTSQKT